jgi:hypothetical protein
MWIGSYDGKPVAMYGVISMRSFLLISEAREKRQVLVLFVRVSEFS